MADIVLEVSQLKLTDERPSQSSTSKIAPQAAATRVFNITELLEHILLRIPPGNLDDFYNLGTDNIRAHVATFLYSLQRVNRTFATTIQNSPKLRQRMMLEVPQTPASSLPLLTLRNLNALRPLVWFLTRGGLECQMTCNRIVLHYTGGLHAKVWTYASPKDSITPKRFLERKASWRKIPILEYDPLRPVIFKMTVQFGEYKHSNQAYKEDLVLNFEECPTLGKFHDLCVKLRERREEEHMKAWTQVGADVGLRECCEMEY